MNKTVGAIASELLQKQPETLNPIEQMQEQLSDYDKNIYMCISRYRSQFDSDFYVVVITKKERLLQNVIRNYFTARLSCPTPDYDQTVYFYDRANESLEFMWTVPSKDTCELFLRNKHEIVPEEYPLLEFIIKFSDGTLLQLAKKLNKEAKDSLLIA